MEKIPWDAMLDWIYDRYNQTQRHTTLDGCSPIEFELKMAALLVCSEWDGSGRPEMDVPTAMTDAYGAKEIYVYNR